jgi:prolyl-tRNA synthetase
LTQFLGVSAQQVFKTLIYMADRKPVAVVVRGDHEVNELKVKRYLNVEEIELADSAASAAAAGAPVGFVGPVGLQLPVLVDLAVVELGVGVVGANETDYHLIHVVPGRDFSVAQSGDFRNVKEGDPCPSCTDGSLQFYKGIEVGQVFKLGTKYSESMGARYVDAGGGERSMIMGCYGIGVSRLFAAIAEQHHDERGIVWPAAVAPFQVHLIPVSTQDEAQLSLALTLYHELRGRGVEVLLDDRAERAGVKFNDADLLGIPLRVVIGRDAADGKVELMERVRMEKQLLSKEEALSRIVEAFAR